MDTLTIQAVYVGGVFRPTVAPDLPDGATVDLRIIRRVEPAETQSARRQRRALALAGADQLCREIRQRRGGIPIQMDIPALIHELREERDASIIAASHRD